MYTLRFGDVFLNSVKRLDRVVQMQLKKKLVKLENGVAKLEPLHEKLSGKYKIRVGNYRIILKFISEKKIFLLEVGPRDKIYK